MGLFCFLCLATTSYFLVSMGSYPIPSLALRDLDVVATFKEAGCIYMAKSFDHETEIAIDEAMVRLEAERRTAENRITALMDNFFFDFPKVVEEDYKHRLTPSQVVNLVQQYVSEMVPASYVFAILRGKGYIQVVEKGDYPIQTYWLFG